MQVVLVMDCKWSQLGSATETIQDDGHEAVPFNSGLRALEFCNRSDVRIDAVFINLHNSGPGAGLWLADQIARVRPGVPVTVTSYVFRTVPDGMPGSIRLWPKPVTRDMLLDAAAGREAAVIADVGARLRAIPSW